MDFWNAAKNIGEALTETAKKAAHGVADFAADPKGHMETAAAETKNFLRAVQNDPSRMGRMALQGIVRGGIAQVGMASDLLGDAGIGLYNLGKYGVSKLTGRAYEKTAYIALGQSEDYLVKRMEKFGYTEIFPENNYERTMMYGIQGITETAAFIGVSALTAGTAGAAMATVRGGGIAARGLATAARTASIMSPFSGAAALGIETAFTGHNIYSNVQEAKERQAAMDADVRRTLGMSDENEGPSLSSPYSRPENSGNLGEKFTAARENIGGTGNKELWTPEELADEIGNLVDSGLVLKKTV